MATTSFGRALMVFGTEAAMARETGYTKQAINVAKLRGRFSPLLRSMLALAAQRRGKRLPADSLIPRWKVDKRNGSLKPVK